MSGAAGKVRGQAGHAARMLVWFAPVLALLVLVILYPVCDLAWISVSEMRYFTPVRFVGLANFTALFGSSDFADMTVVSLTFLCGTLALTLLLGLVSAVALQALPRHRATLIRTVLLLPWTLSMTVVGCLWLWLLNPSYGLIRYLLELVGIPPGLMLGDPDLALWLVILTTVWWSFPYPMVLLTAALQSVPKELYEAIEMDGGGWLQQFAHVTWPHILPTLANAGVALCIVYLTLVSLLVVMTGGGPLGATTTWSFAIYNQTMNSVDVSSSAVLSVVVLATNICLGIASKWIAGRTHVAG